MKIKSLFFILLTPFPGELRGMKNSMSRLGKNQWALIRKVWEDTILRETQT
jgi:hypothetical protein